MKEHLQSLRKDFDQQARRLLALAIITLAGTTGANIAPPIREHGRPVVPPQIVCTDKGDSVDIFIRGDLSRIPGGGGYNLPLFDNTEASQACQGAIARLNPVAGDTYAQLAGRYLGKEGHQGFMRTATIDRNGKPVGEITFFVYGFSGRAPYPDEGTGSFHK